MGKVRSDLVWHIYILKAVYVPVKYLSENG